MKRALHCLIIQTLAVWGLASALHAQPLSDPVADQVYVAVGSSKGQGTILRYTVNGGVKLVHGAVQKWATCSAATWCAE